MTPPQGFEVVRSGRTTLLVRADLREWLVPLLCAAGTGWAGYERRPLAGGRGGTQLVCTAGHEVVLRPARRGGLPGRVLYDTYLGWRPRPFRELRTIERLRRHGAPVVEVYGAAVRWLVPGCYRGWLVTRYLSGAQTLWQWASGARSTAERRTVFRNVGSALHRLHATGTAHPDLNLNNILIGPTGEVVFIDFDQAHQAHGRNPAIDLARLARSARKLDTTGVHVSVADLEELATAYRTSETGAT